MRWIRAAAAAWLTVPFLAAGHARAQSFAGTWESSVATRVEVVGGVQTPSGMASVTMKIELRGDSAFATWERGKVEGVPDAPLRHLKGVVSNGELTLVSEPAEAHLNRNGEDETVRMVSTYHLRVAGDELTGTITTASENDVMSMPDRPFKATRKKA